MNSKNLKALVENHTSKNIKVLIPNNGGEYFNVLQGCIDQEGAHNALQLSRDRGCKEEEQVHHRDSEGIHDLDTHVSLGESMQYNNLDSKHVSSQCIEGQDTKENLK